MWSRRRHGRATVRDRCRKGVATGADPVSTVVATSSALPVTLGFPAMAAAPSDGRRQVGSQIYRHSAHLTAPTSLSLVVSSPPPEPGGRSPFGYCSCGSCCLSLAPCRTRRAPRSLPLSVVSASASEYRKPSHGWCRKPFSCRTRFIRSAESSRSWIVNQQRCNCALFADFTL